MAATRKSLLSWVQQVSLLAQLPSSNDRNNRQVQVHVHQTSNCFSISAALKGLPLGLHGSVLLKPPIDSLIVL